MFGCDEEYIKTEILNAMIKKDFKFATIICLVFILSCKNKLLVVNRSQIDNLEQIDIERKGINHQFGFTLIEEKWARDTGITQIQFKEYSISTPEGKVFNLELEPTFKKELYYFEFLSNHLFIISKLLAPFDAIDIRIFDLKNGKIIYETIGKLPCTVAEKFDFSWNFSESDCNWISLKDKKLVFLRNILDPQEQALDSERKTELYSIFSLDWDKITIDTILPEFSPQLDSVSGGFKQLPSLKYNAITNKFGVN